MESRLKLIVMPSIVEKCEGCGSGPKEDIKDLELRNGTRQVARVFLCKTCRDDAAKKIAGVV